ncbi:hypothetical protein VCR14J2_610091 [Vibrio coralliirubri]|nr:hypothetical protein VCR14J2_610091 [Vibrio coralliirubri]
MNSHILRYFNLMLHVSINPRYFGIRFALANSLMLFTELWHVRNDNRNLDHSEPTN